MKLLQRSLHHHVTINDTSCCNDDPFPWVISFGGSDFTFMLRNKSKGSDLRICTSSQEENNGGLVLGSIQ